MTKKQFISKLLHERDKFELLLNRVGYTRRMTLKGVAGKWSIKDVLAHVWAYEQYIADRMAEIQHGELYTPCKTQAALYAFQDEFGYPHRNVSLEDLIAQELQAFSSIVLLLQTMPEEMIHHHNLYNRVINHTDQQYREHIHEIKHWLKVNGVQLK